jgi:hypothetical protein
MKQYAVIVHEALKESGINFVAYLPDHFLHGVGPAQSIDLGKERCKIGAI